jgi:peptide/nickel transport system substrate-binding protein
MNHKEGQTRRQLLRSATAGGLALAAGDLLAGCGGATTKSSAAKATGPIKRGGKLRVGVAGGSAKDTIDAHLGGTTDPDIARGFQLYEPLAIRDRNYELKMLVAESIEPDGGADRWVVRVRDGVTFHDGRPVTADDVIFSLRRIIDPKSPGTGASSLAGIDAKRLKKADARTVRIVLKEADSGFPDQIGQYFNTIVPTDYDPKAPVGTGPFRFKSFTPGQESRFVRFDGYWDGPAHLDEVVIIDFPDDTARVNALLGGQVDCISNLPPSQVKTVQARSALRALVSETGGWQPLLMRVDQAPFDDVRVRQAFKLIVDRDQMIQQALDGQGRVANDIYAPYDPAYNHDLPQRKQDIEQAKSLLRQAGRSDVRVELTTAPFAAGVVEAAQVFAQQAKAAGVNVQVKKVNQATYFGPQYLKWTFSQDFWFTRGFLAQVAQGNTPDAPYNQTHWNDDRFLSLFAQAKRELDEGKRTELIHEMQKLQYDEGGEIIWSFNNQVDGYSAALSGFAKAKSGIPLSSYGFKSVGFVS